MFKGLNRVLLIGTLINDPETKHFSNNSSFFIFTISTYDIWKSKIDNNFKSRVEFHKIVYYGNLLDLSFNFLKKNSRVYIEGSIRKKKWIDNNKNVNYSTDIIAFNIQNLDDFFNDVSSYNKVNNNYDNDNNIDNKEIFYDDVPF